MNASTSPLALATADPSIAPLGGETAGTHMAITARATVEARYLVALRNRRDWDIVRQELLKSCQRPKFANSKRTYYVMPYDSSIHGLGVGFAEEAIRVMGNIYPQQHTVFNSPDVEIVRVTVTDLESNVPWEGDVTIEKTVERSKPLADGTPDGFYLSKRKNSSNNWTYVVPAREDELIDKRQSMVSKMMRSCALKHLPAWLKEECIDQIFATREAEVGKDPDGERTRLIDAFGSIGVKVSDLVAYVRHDLSTCSPSELVKLRAIYQAITSGAATWHDYAEGREAPPAAPKPGPAKPMSKSAQATQDTAGTSSPSEAASNPAAASPAASTAGPATSGASAAPSPAPASQQVEAHAADSTPLASEGTLKYLLNTAKRKGANLARIFEHLKLPQLQGKSEEEVKAIVDGCQFAAIQGLTEAQFNSVKSLLAR